VNSCERVAFDPAVHAALLNRAGGAQV
jgi:hypothetical protein